MCLNPVPAHGTRFLLIIETEEFNVTDEELLLAIHNQCEAVRATIGTHYNKPCADILKEVIYLKALLMAYIIKYL
jgi:hypothetical protein